MSLFEGVGSAGDPTGVDAGADLKVNDLTEFSDHCPN
jgi:hypothetical protein